MGLLNPKMDRLNHFSEAIYETRDFYLNSKRSSLSRKYAGLMNTNEKTTKKMNKNDFAQQKAAFLSIYQQIEHCAIELLRIKLLL